MSFNLSSRLAERRAAHLYRQRPLLQTPQGVEVLVDGERLLSFCSNDYLGLANDPRVNDAFVEGVQRWGTGGGASHLPKFFESRYIQVDFFKPWDGDAWHMASRFAFSFSFALVIAVLALALAAAAARSAGRHGEAPPSDSQRTVQSQAQESSAGAT